LGPLARPNTRTGEARRRQSGEFQCD
jgi:hypothetical protein